MSPTQSLATRRIVESFQRGTALKDFRAASAATNRADLATAPGGNDYNAIQEFETKVNAPDYPKELKDLYYLGKSKGDYKDFNESVTKYNTEQQAKQAEFEKKIDSQDYPEELRKAYKEAKSKGDLTSFNDTVDKYNAKQKQAVEAFEKVVNSPDYPPELKEAYDKSKKADDFKPFNNAVEAYNTRQNQQQQGGGGWDGGTVTPAVNIPTDREISDLKDNINNMPPEYQDAYRSYVEGLERAASDTVQVGTNAGKPEYVSKYDYDKIAAADKANGTKYLDVLKEKGVTGLNATVNIENEHADANQKVYEKDQADFEKTINAPDYPEKLRDIYNRDKKTGDFTSFNNAVDSWNITTAKEIEDFEKNNHVINGIGISNKDWDSLHPELKKIAEKEGYQVMFDSLDLWEKNRLTAPKWYRESFTSAETQDRIEKQMAALEPYKDKDGNYDLITYLDDIKNKTYKDTAHQQPLKGVLGKAGAVKTVGTSPDWNGLRQQLVDSGFDEKAVDNSIYQAKLDPVQRFWQGKTPWNEQKGETATVGGGLQMTAEWLVPGVYAAGHWNEMSAGEKAFNILVDAISVAYPAARAGTASARSVAGFATRAGVMQAYGKGFAMGAARAIVPIDLVLHPIGAAKASASDLRTLAEDLANPKKLPVMSVSTSDGTARIIVGRDMSAAEAKIARDKLMEAVQRGERVVVELKDGRIIELRRAAIMKELPGSFAHTTPQGEAFEFGTTVKTKYREVTFTGPDGKEITAKYKMPNSEQGIFYAPDPILNTAKKAAFGGTGEKSVIIITSPETSAKLVSSEKLYKGKVGLTAEGERKLPVGESTKPIGQRLYTRLADGTRVEIWLEEGLKLSPGQIAKLKAKGIIEIISAPFSPALKIKGGRIKGSGLSPADVDYLATQLRRAGANGEARNLLRVQQQLVTARAAIPRVTLRAGQGLMQIRKGMGERETKRAKVVIATRKTSLNSRELQSRVKRISTERAPSLKGTPVRNTDFNRTNKQAERVTEKATRQNEQQRGNTEKGRNIETTRTFETNRVPPAGRTQPATRIQTEKRVPPTNRTSPTNRLPPGQRTPPTNRVPPMKQVPPTNRVPPTRREPPPPRVPPPPPPTHNETGKLSIGKGKDKQRRNEIESAKYSVGYRLGELKGKPVWHTFVSNGDQWQRVMVIGRPPKGVKVTASGPDSAYKTIQHLTQTKGIKGNPIREDIGAFVTTINTGKGNKPGIQFKQDDNKAIISNRMPQITPPTLRITPRMPRITPRMPRITPRPPRITPKWRRLPR